MNPCYPVDREYPLLFELWALGKMLMLFGMIPRSRRKVLFLRLQTLLEVSGSLT